MNGLIPVAFIGPGGPELIVVMLVLLLLFGSKDAPKVFRKINEFINQMRNTADGFKREIMYSDLNEDASSSDTAYELDEDGEDHDEDYDYDADCMSDMERDYSNETYQHLEEDLDGIKEHELAELDDAMAEGDEGILEDEDGHAQKT